jgi:hypothetical protein
MNILKLICFGAATLFFCAAIHPVVHLNVPSAVSATLFITAGVFA